MSLLPGAKQDNWQWSSDKFEFVYTGAGEVLDSSVGIDAAENAADFVGGNPSGSGNHSAVLEKRRSEGLNQTRRQGRCQIRKVGEQGWQGLCRI